VINGHQQHTAVVQGQNNFSQEQFSGGTKTSLTGRYRKVICSSPVSKNYKSALNYLITSADDRLPETPIFDCQATNIVVVGVKFLDYNLRGGEADSRAGFKSWPQDLLL